jgi:hypothetical protein
VSPSFDLLFHPPSRHACSIDGAQLRAPVPAPSTQATDRLALLHGSLWSERADLHGETGHLSPRAAVSGVVPAPAGVLAVHFSSPGTEVGK